MRFVADLYQVKTRGRRGYLGQISIAGRENSFEPLPIVLASTNTNQAPGNISNHVVKKSVGPDVEIYQIALAGNFDTVQIARR